MTNRYLFAAMLAGASMTALAAVPQFKVAPVGAEPEMKTRPAVKKFPSKAKESSARISQKAAAGPQRIVTAYGEGCADIEKYGTLRLLLEEDFSLLTTGTEEQPDLDAVLDIDWQDPAYTYPWWNFQPEFTHLPHWGVGNAYPAGGSLYFYSDEQNDQAHVNTCLVDCTTGEGNIAVLEFRARCQKPGATYDYLIVEGADTDNMGPTWDVYEDQVVFSGVPDQWTTFRVVYRNCGPTSIFNIVAGLGPIALLIDDVKVYQLDPKVAMPEVLPHSDYEGSSFTANWKPVEGADKYILNVWAYDNSTYANDYIVKDEEVTGTSFDVTNAISGETYYYNVVAVKGDDVSLPSFDQRVYDLEVPVLNPVDGITDYKYTASWNVVPGGEVYNYMAYNTRTAEEDGAMVLTNEDFTGILNLDGFPTGLTKENPADGCWDQYYCNELHQQGWVGKNCMPYDDYIALDAYQYEMNNDLAAWMSPELDLSKDGGKFTIEADLAANTTTMYDDNDNRYFYTTQACAVLWTWNEELGDYEQVEITETYNTDPVTEDWKHYVFNFTKGTDRSLVAICAVTSLDNLYIDNFKMTQNYKKGESFLDPFRYKRFHGSNAGEIPNNLEVEIPWWASGGDVYHKVSAFGRQVDKYGNSYDDRESKYTALELVGKTEKLSGVTEIAGEQAKVTRMADRIVISNPETKAVTVTTLGGQTLLRTSEEAATVALDARGVYIVRVGNRTFKIVY